MVCQFLAGNLHLFTKWRVYTIIIEYIITRLHKIYTIKKIRRFAVTLAIRCFCAFANKAIAENNLRNQNLFFYIYFINFNIYF